MVSIRSAADHATVVRELKVLFPDMKKKGDYVDDFATIICFLSDRSLFEQFFAVVSRHAELRYNRLRGLGGKNALTSAFQEQFVALDQVSQGSVGCGFKDGHERIVLVLPGRTHSASPSQNVTLTGNAADVFGAVLSHGYLFKDGTGPSHGEYAHTLQWLVISYAKFAKAITLTHPVLTLYKNAGALPFSNAVATLSPEDDSAVQMGLPFWSFIADAFRSSELHGQAENFKENLFVENYRSPSYLTDQMLHRRLSQTFLGTHLQQHYEKRGFKTGHGQRVRVRDHYNYAGPQTPFGDLNRILSSLRQTVNASGTTTNITLPGRLEQDDKAFFDDLKARTLKSRKGQDGQTNSGTWL